ncbi:MAG: hypothetical protein ACK5NK_12190 [Niabella sp.]
MYSFRKIFVFILIFTVAFISKPIFAQTAINKADFFMAMSSSSQKKIDAQLAVLKKLSGTEKNAFEGALLMRKAGTLTIPAKKLAMFKDGHKKLEAVIAQYPGNAEYRFLRLMVQENAPRALGYYKSISQDSKFIKEQYKNLPEVTKNSISAYSKQSKSLAGAF